MNGKNKTLIKSGIKVTIHLPEKITENRKQVKINTIYDILNSKRNTGK